MEKSKVKFYNVNSHRWEDIVKHALQNHQKSQHIKKRKLLMDYYRGLLKFIPIPIIIGGLAAYYMYIEFGWKALEQSLLSWTIGLTLIATIVASIVGRFKKLNMD
jgi:hypothetical protein